MKITASIPIVVMIFQRVEFKVDKSILDYKKQGRKCVNNQFMKRKMEKFLILSFEHCCSQRYLSGFGKARRKDLRQYTF